MKRVFITAMIILAASSFVAAQNTTPSQIEQELRQAHQQMIDAYNDADKAAAERLVADDYIFIGSDGRGSGKANMISHLPKQKGQFKRTETLTDVQVRDFGDVALLSYVSDRVTQFGEQKLSDHSRGMELYRRRNGQWQLVATQATAIPELKDPPIAKIDPKLLDEYAGQYEVAPGAIITVTRQGDKMFINEEEWLPENETTFFSKGRDARTAFVRDVKGKVIEMSGRFGGQMIKAKKIK